MTYILCLSWHVKVWPTKVELHFLSSLALDGFDGIEHVVVAPNFGDGMF